jgi:hypothetical protein
LRIRSEIDKKNKKKERKKGEGRNVFGCIVRLVARTSYFLFALLQKKRNKEMNKKKKGRGTSTFIAT